MELYDHYSQKKIKFGEKDPEQHFLLTIEDLEFIVQYEEGRFINIQCCLLEFYFMLLCDEYQLAVILLQQPYAKLLQDDLNQKFIGDESNLLKQILIHPEITKDCIKLGIVRQLDGIAL